MVTKKVIYLTINFLLFSLLFCSKAPTTIASRPLLNDHEISSESSLSKEIEDVLKDHGYSVGAVKSSGPSSRGAGHKVKGLPSLRTLKDSGPSPGVGHKSVTANDHH